MASYDNPERGNLEKQWLKSKSSLVGVDEVGRGCIAGPVFAACVAIDYDELFALPDKKRALIRDSKTLSAKQREEIAPIIKAIATESYIAMVSVQKIEEYGIRDASLLAMQRAISLCQKPYDVVMVDGRDKIPEYMGKQLSVIGGDNLAYCIAAASILAKISRDRYMQKASEKFPEYQFEKHVGYGTKAHMEALATHGACPLHRKTFAPVRRALSHSKS